MIGEASSFPHGKDSLEYARDEKEPSFDVDAEIKKLLLFKNRTTRTKRDEQKCISASEPSNSILPPPIKYTRRAKTTHTRDIIFVCCMKH